MKDYKQTLNLPKTDFPMKADLAKREPVMLEHWQSLQLYQQLRQRGAQSGRQYILHDGPPYANGAIHLGTTMNKVLKDIIIKSRNLSGFDTPYVPGWDCHGLPIELFVEKEVGKPGVKLSIHEFRQKCREFANSQLQWQKQDFKRLGCVADWDHPYLTMDFKYEADEIRAFAQIVRNGHVQRGQKPVHWCTACSSALAEAEVEYRDKKSPAIDVTFFACEPRQFTQAFGVESSADVVIVPIWTTTPWTLPANQAVALNPEIDYSLLEAHLHGQVVLMVVASDLVDAVMMRYHAEDYKEIAKAAGRLLEGFKLEHPFAERSVPIILGDHVTTETGTGCVHTAPAHGDDDYVVGLRYQLSIDNPIDNRSCFLAKTPIVGGLHVTKANEPIIEALGQSGHLLHHTTISHSFPHCWRHKTPLIFRATTQWFISMEKAGLRQQALKAIEEKVEWIPQWGRNRIYSMIEKRPDWCISRQRAWGVPLALIVHKESGELHPNMPELMLKVADLVEQNGIDAWDCVELASLLGSEADEYEKVYDTLDVWFDSGMSHFCVLEQRPELTVPADLYLEGSDQHRGWFHTSLLTAIAMRGEPPYKKVLTHGYVVDGKGHKMSKSIGNIITPGEVIEKAGADILRLWAAAADHTGDVSFSAEIQSRISDAYRRIRNTARFLLSNLNDFDPAKDAIPAEQMLQLDLWALDHTKKLQEKIIEAYDKFHFQSVYQLILNFCTNEMGSFYLDILKDRLYTCRQDGLPRRSAQTAMMHILEALVRWLAPILSFTADEIWQHMPVRSTEMVFLTQWYENIPTVAVDAEYWQWLMQVRDEVNRVLESHRKRGEIGSALDANVVLHGSDQVCERLAMLQEELRFVLITSGAQVLLDENPDPTAEATSISGLTVAVHIADSAKCVRCWQRRHDVGAHKEHEGLCGRCVENVIGSGEIRLFA